MKKIDDRKRGKNSITTEISMTYPPTDKNEKKNKTIFHFILNGFIAFLICGGIVLTSDLLGIFNPDVSQGFQKLQSWKWDGYIDFAKLYPIDIVLFGSSHINRGLTPINLSLATGTNSFAAAFNGTTLTYLYFVMKQAFEIQRPKVAVVETYPIYNINNYERAKLSYNDLGYTFFHFNFAKNTLNKLSATAYCFPSDYWLSSWSNTLRNHNLIMNDFQKIIDNWTGKNEYKKWSETNSGLYLGQNIGSGLPLQDSMLKKLENEENIIDAAEFLISDEAKKYIRKIKDLCDENGVKLLFVTVPSYYRCIKNWDVFKSNLNIELNKYNIPWLDLQSPYDTTLYNQFCFENTIDRNQHLTLVGTKISAHKLAEYLKKNYSDILPNRENNPQYINYFYENSDYLYYYPLPDNDKINKGFFKNKNVGNYLVKEVDYVFGNINNIILKVTGNQDVTTKKILVLVAATYQNQQINAWIELEYMQEYFGLNHYVFQCNINEGVQIDDVLAVQIN
ncbi:MAG: hypothetical protein LBO69_01240 [Ignavibacteria bacterium]|jgi:hypothetical protein|nr:hypothetical protein [Ignavibacteria bacterium]